MAKLTMTFYSDELSQKKNHEIYLCASTILQVKNELSSFVYDNIFRFYTMSLEEFSEAVMPEVLEKIDEDFSLGIINDLFFSYVPTFKEIYHNLYFKDSNYDKNITFSLSKNNSDNASESFYHIPVSLAQVLTYLARNNNDDVINLLRKGLGSKYSNRSSFCQGVLDYIEQYTLERLTNVVNYKRNKLLKGILPGPIFFKDFNFLGRSFLTGDIISPNRNTHSAIKAFIQLSWRNGGIISIPVRLNNIALEDLKYISSLSTKIYRIRFERRGQVAIVLHCEGSFIKREVEEEEATSNNYYPFYRSNNYSFCNFVC
jgi:hypothetical protein